MNSQKLGKIGESIAMLLLKQLGAKCIEKIPTHVSIVKGKAIYTQKSSVDITAVLPSPGCIYPYYAVRVEVKLCDDDRLRHSRLKPHQVEWLTEWVYLGFKSFIIWVHKNNAVMFEYPHSKFQPGKSITIDDAIKISCAKLNKN